MYKIAKLTNHGARNRCRVFNSWNLTLSNSGSNFAYILLLVLSNKLIDHGYIVFDIKITSDGKIYRKERFL